MINSFIVSLVNSSTPPVNPSSTLGDIYWPENVRVRTYTGEALTTRDRLFRGATGLAALAKAVQYLWLVENSVCAPYILRDDPRTSYTQAQLLAQLTGLTDRQVVTQALAEIQLDVAPPFLPLELADVFTGALSRSDRLAALVVYYGVQW